MNILHKNNSSDELCFENKLSLLNMSRDITSLQLDKMNSIDPNHGLTEMDLLSDNYVRLLQIMKIKMSDV